MTFPPRIGRYHILGYLASGGMAEILLGKLLGPGGFEQAVVIKRALPHLARRREFHDMFLDEARVVARIQHPNVVTVTELGEDERDLYMVMEYLAGESVAGLGKRLHARGEWLPLDVSLYVVTQVLAGLHAAHEVTGDEGEPLGLVHRDVSPHNLFVTYDGRVKLLDFGIAKFVDRSVETSTGTLKGKFAYMSPEQCVDAPIDRRSDVFSCGIVLWELIAGERLFKRSNELLCWKAIVEEDIPAPSAHRAAGAPSLPAELEAIVMRALAKEPAARPSTAADLRRDLLAVLRAIDPEDRAKDRLVALLERTFADRIAQKKELLRRVRSGDEVTSIPSAEVDIEIEETIGIEPTTTEPEASAPSASARRRRIAIPIAAGLGLALAVALGVALASNDREDPTPAQAPPRVAELPAAPTPLDEGGSADLPPTAPTEPTAPAHVVVELQTVPAGAAVLGEDDAALCTTPCRLELPPGSAARTLRIRLDGYRDHEETLVPDMNQRLRVTLLRAPSSRGRRTAREPTPTTEEPARGGFYRFD